MSQVTLTTCPLSCLMMEEISYTLEMDLLTKTPLLQVHSINGLFILNLNLNHSPQAFLSNRASTNVWHARLGHPSIATTLEVVNSNKLSCSRNKFSLCHDCAQAKAHVLPFSPSSSVSTSPLQIVHSDVWGPSPIVSSQGFRYYITFVDDYSKFTWIYFMKQKSEVSHIFSIFKAQVENLLDCTIKTLRTDGGTEYKPITNQFPQILHQTSCPYTPQQNGHAERKHRHIIELALANMSYASIPLKYWDEIFSSVVFLINRLPSNKFVPFTILFKKNPNYSILKILGCQCFPLTRPYNSHKLELRSLPCVFLGYSSSQKGYRCLDLQTNKVYISRNVTFDESIFPFKQNKQGLISSCDFVSAHSPIMPLQISSIQQAHQPSGPSQPTLEPTSQQPVTTAPLSSSSDQLLSPQINQTPISATRIPSAPVHPITTRTPAASSSDNTVLTTSSLPSSSNQPTPQQIDHTPSPADQLPPAPLHSMTTRTRDQTRKTRVFTDFVAHHASMETEPRTFNQANSLPAWRQAMAVELHALALNKTWTLVPPPANQKVLSSKWVYKIKRKPDGTIDRFKARLVANGFHQEEGVDFMETYSPVVRPTTIRVVLSIAMSSQWQIKQLDVQNAFLHGDLTETVYMAQPKGFVDPTFPNHVCLLHKSLYGLKQAPRAWFLKLSNALVSFGFKSSNYDPSLFISNHNGHKLFVLVYVDDIIVTGDDDKLVAECIEQLSTQFAVKDLGKLHYFLGIEAQFTTQGLLLTQSKYLADLLNRVNMINSKPVLTPMATGVTLSKDDGALFDDPHLYRSVIGALQYATLTRPDISFTVNKLSQFMHDPTLNHWTAAKRLLRYLCGTLKHGILIHSTSTNTIHAYSDADWAGSIDDRRSTSGFCVYLGRNLVSWCAKKQPTVLRSSTEAEYRSLALTCTEIKWLTYLLEELGIAMVSKPCLWCDNIGATFLASNPMFHARTKHIEIDYHFVREQVADNKLDVKFICSADQLSDVMTKPLPLPRFQFLRGKLNVQCGTLA
ncbi:Gag/pol [Rhynchospora pubera]|uniref:Gag/pol n=1 Tax=Rhynchospora pubera TaxID=906938 RepID=A0AAV8DMF8_9POAL|nr:Gag/pol [Rhynchospora pubera]